MKKPPVSTSGWITKDSDVNLPTAGDALRIWHIASAINHLIAAFPSCPKWVSTAVDHCTKELDCLMRQEVA